MTDRRHNWLLLGAVSLLAGCGEGPPLDEPALDHARRGFVPHGAPSLPVHPTELYEAAVGLIGGALAAIPVLRGRRDGQAFATFLATYAIGRFALEFLRGDQDRGQALGLSTAQWVSVTILAALIAAWARRRVAVGRAVAAPAAGARA